MPKTSAQPQVAKNIKVVQKMQQLVQALPTPQTPTVH